MPDFGMPPLTRGERFYRSLLRFYPARFREEFGLDLLETFRDEHKAVVRDRTSHILFWLATIRDVLVHAFAERMSVESGRRNIRHQVHPSMWRSIEHASADFRIASRALRRRPGFAATAILTLALAIGANSAVFSVVDAVVLRPLSIPDASRAVALFRVSKTSPYENSSLGTFTELANRNHTLERVAAFTSWGVPLVENNTSEDLKVEFVTAQYFSVVGIRASLGRLLLPRDSVDGAESQVAVLSDAFWRSRFGSDPAIVGRSIKLAGQQVTVVGVAAPNFRGTDLSKTPDIWLPTSIIPRLELGASAMGLSNDPHSELNRYAIVARLHEDVTIDEAALDANTVERARRSVLEPSNLITKSNAPLMSALSINDAAASVNDRATLIAYLRLLCSVVGITLLLACLNIANLMVVRSRERSVELGVRSALGATSAMLTRYLLIEAFVLATAGGVLGLLISVSALKLFSAFALPGGIAIGNLHAGLDARVFLFASVLTIVSALVFGLYPAISGSKKSVLERFRSSESSARPRLLGRGALLAMQVGIALTLLAGAATFLETLQAGLSANLGFDSDHIAAVSIKPRFDGSREENAALYANVVRRIQEIPGVEAAAATSHVPLAGLRALPFQRGAATTAPNPDIESVLIPMASVTPDYFNVLGVPIVEGRNFSSVDGPDSKRVTIINQSAARQLWPSESAIGKQMNFINDVTYTVIGVSRDTKYSKLQDKGVVFAYAPMTQEDTRGNVTFLVKTARPALLLSQMQASISDAAPQLTTVRPRVVRDQINSVLLPQRFGATLLSSFALLAIILSTVGIHGTVAYTVSRRRRELGVRMALGASTMSVMRTVLQDVAIATVAGVLVGGALVLGTQKLLSHFLLDVSGSGLTQFSVSTVVLCVIALVASAIPARLAARIDPMSVIRPS